MPNPFTHFLDLCFHANTSVLIFISKFYGFYLHGEYNGQSSDVDMSHHLLYLQSEENDQQPKRGLEGEDKVVYQIFLTKEFRDSFTEKYGEVQTRVVQTKKQADKNIETVTGLVSKEALGFFYPLNKFLATFAKNEDQLHPRVNEDPSILHRLINFPPHVSNQNIFLRQNDSAFKSCLLYGIEFTLFVFYLLLYAGLEIATKSTVIPSLVVYCVDVLVQIFFKSRARINLAKKALLDDRFIIT